MKFRLRLAAAGLAASAAFGQTPAPEEKAPADVDSALRARVSKFYDAHVSGKMREAYLLVSEDSQDYFLSAGANKLEACELLDIVYREKFTKAEVTEKCKTDLRWHGKDFVMAAPFKSFWKVESGQWYWYHFIPNQLDTPFGPSVVDRAAIEGRTSNSPASQGPVIPDPQTLAKQILTQVKVDKTEIHLVSAKLSKDQVTVSNGMPGPVTLTIDDPHQPGLTVKADKLTLEAGQTAKIAIEYNPNDKALACFDCAKHIEGTTIAQIHVQPTAQMFPIKIVLEGREKNELALPKQ